MSADFDTRLGELHAKLLHLWGGYLKNNSLTLDDDFFENGGDSLLAVEMVVELEKIVITPLPETIVFEFPTIRELADSLLSLSDLDTAPQG